jgi:adenylate cyclase
MGQEFRVANWLIEPDLNRVTDRDKTVSVEPKVMDVLVCLAAQPGEVIPKDKIMSTVWPGTFVGDEVLTYSVSELRKALGDDAKNPRFIQTIPRKGYRLIAAVSRKQDAPKPKSSIAVLPFSDLSSQKDQEYFCDGIAEDIIHCLAHVKGLRVASRTSAFAYKGRSEDVRSIGKSLGVGAILEGSVRKSESHLRITAQLINTEDGCHLWSERYDRELRDIFAIQDEISTSIVRALQITLSATERDAISAAPTTDVEAYDYYLRGMQFFYQYTRSGVEFALKMFSRAIELDPDYVRAHAGISDCCSFLYMYAGTHEEHRRQACAASTKAVTLNPDSAQARASRGLALTLTGAYAEAEAEFQAAIRLDANLFEAYYFYARASFAQGNAPKAIELYQKASQVRPDDYQSPLLVAQIYTDAGLPAEAEASRRRGIKVVEARLRLNPDDARALYMGANGLVGLGEYERGLEWATQALAMKPDDPMVLYNVSCIQSLAGKLDDAMDCLERAVKNGLNEKGWLEHDSNLEPLRRSKRYQALIRQLDKIEAEKSKKGR